MKKLTLTVAAQCPAGVSHDTYTAAKKLGDIEMNAVTAMENLRNSGGLYVLKAEPKPEVEIRGLKAPGEMSKEELVMEMTMWGKPPRKRMTRDKAVEFVEKLRQAGLDMILGADDEADDQDETPAAPPPDPAAPPPAE